MEAHAVDVGRVGGGLRAAGMVVLVHEALQEGLRQGTRRAVFFIEGDPAAPDAVVGQRHADHAGHEEAHGGKGQTHIERIGDLIGVFPDGGVGLRLAGALREAGAQQVTVAGEEVAAEEHLPEIEGALADESLDGEEETEDQRHPERAARDDLTRAFLVVAVAFQQADAHEAEGEEVEGQHGEHAGGQGLPAEGAGHADQAQIDEHEAQDAADERCREKHRLEDLDLGPDDGSDHEQQADPAETADIRIKRAFHRSFLALNPVHRTPHLRPRR